jgi:hypothetical protein
VRRQGAATLGAGQADLHWRMGWRSDVAHVAKRVKADAVIKEVWLIGSLDNSTASENSGWVRLVFAGRLTLEAS